MKLDPRPVRPALEITRSAQSLIISWPADAEGFALESSATQLGETWNPVAGTPLLLGGRTAIVIRPSAQAQFFRLKRP